MAGEGGVGHFPRQSFRVPGCQEFCYLQNMPFEATQGFNIHPANRGKVGKSHLGGLYTPNLHVARITSPTSHWLEVRLLPHLDEKMKRAMISGGPATFQRQPSKRGNTKLWWKVSRRGRRTEVGPREWYCRAPSPGGAKV